MKNIPRVAVRKGSSAEKWCAEAAGFPTIPFEVDGDVVILEPDLRDQFAMAALTGLVDRVGTSWKYGKVAATAYAFADAMMAAREK